MSDGQLVQHLHVALDPLISTAAEAELLKRVEALLDEQDPEFDAKVEEYGFDATDIEKLGDALIVDAINSAELLSVLNENDLNDPDSLKDELELAKQFRALVEDAGDLFTRLSDLSTNAQE
jgi:hypothetical protein